MKNECRLETILYKCSTAKINIITLNYITYIRGKLWSPPLPPPIEASESNLFRFYLGEDPNYKLVSALLPPPPSPPPPSLLDPCGVWGIPLIESQLINCHFCVRTLYLILYWFRLQQQKLIFIKGTTDVRWFCLTITITSDVHQTMTSNDYYFFFWGGGDLKLSDIGENLIHWAY